MDLKDNIAKDKSKTSRSHRSQNSIKLTKTQILRLIGLYRAHEVLWNINITAYRRNDLRAKALKEISNDMFLPVDLVAKKIKALRNTYAQERKKVQLSKESGSSEDPLYKPSLFWYQEMNFLTDSISTRKYYDEVIVIESVI